MSTEINVVSNADGVTIYIGLVELAPGSEGSPGDDDTISVTEGPNCTATPMNIGNASVGWVREGLEAHPDTVPWSVNCDNGYFGIAWVPTDAPAAPDVVVGEPPIPAVDPVAVQASVLGIVPLPPIKVGANPDVGLVAMPAWFWVDGYDGSTLRGSRTLGLITIEVEITPAGYQWTFGDGAVLDTLSLGRPYPIESDIRHTYEQSSLIAGGTFEVQLDITFSARYRVNGGAWLPLAPVVQTYTRDYPVQQLQSVLTSSQ
ncbi:MAG: hypothetical protein R3C39_10995 [Dehalococcoidia bacterium]